MEQAKRDSSFDLKDQCRDIVIEIYSHKEKLYPSSVKEMIALNPMLTEALLC